MLVIKTKVKEYSGDLQIGSDFMDALDKRVAVLIDNACKRAESNKRKTLREHDL